MNQETQDKDIDEVKSDHIADIGKMEEEFSKKWMIRTGEGGFMKDNCNGIEFYVVTEWLKQALQTVEKETRESERERTTRRIELAIGANSMGVTKTLTTQEILMDLAKALNN